MGSQDVSVGGRGRHTYSTVWDKLAVDYDNISYSLRGVQMMELLASKSDNPSECVRIWIKEIESCGFGSFAYESEVVKYEREDGLDSNAGVKGNCSIFLENGYELNGSWRKKRRHGTGLICGPPLEAKGIKVIWGKYVGGYLS